MEVEAVVEARLGAVDAVGYTSRSPRGGEGGHTSRRAAARAEPHGGTR